MAAMISYIPVSPTLMGTENKARVGPTRGEKRISRTIDTLQAMAKREQSKRWGDSWAQDMHDFFELNYYPASASPSYRPKVIMPELQYLLMGESSELTNDTPKPYISVNGKRDEERERAFSALWKRGMFNNRIFDAVLWSQFCNPASLQVGYNPDMRYGRGSVWIASRDVDTFFPDANAKNDRDWAFVVAEDWFYVDEVKRVWGDSAKEIKVEAGYEDYDEDETSGSGFDISLELPPGPLRVDSPQGFENQQKGPRVRVRYLYVKDYARERVEEFAGNRIAEGLELVVQPMLKWQYPGGRYIVECQGYVLADGPNWCPRLPDDDFSTFPFVGVWSLPHLKHYFGPPPVRYGKGPQDIAERMYTQLIENLIRLNNGITFIPEDSGIDVDAYGGLPGEVQVFRGDKVPEIKWPTPIPDHMTKIPELLLAKVARYVGWTPERQGEAGKGNISPELFDAAIFQSQSLLRMKARLLSETYQRLAMMTFYMMVRFKKIQDVVRPQRSEKQMVAVWNPLPEDAEVEMELDETSIDTMSSAMMKQLAVALGKIGAVPNKFVLETLGVPNAEQMAEEATRQQELAALAKLRRPR
jgi:hypothetical protein